MADETNGAAAEAAPVAMKIVNQYIRDLSFENIAAQKNLGGDLKPEVNVLERRLPISPLFSVGSVNDPVRIFCVS